MDTSVTTQPSQPQITPPSQVSAPPVPVVMDMQAMFAQLTAQMSTMKAEIMTHVNEKLKGKPPPHPGPSAMEVICSQEASPADDSNKPPDNTPGSQKTS